MKTKRPRSSNRKTYYLVLWWMSQTPYAAIFENEVAAEAAANVRNALLVTISGRDAKVDQILDWYRRDESGRPLPAVRRNVIGEGLQLRLSARHQHGGMAMFSKDAGESRADPGGGAGDHRHGLQHRHQSAAIVSVTL